MDAMKEALKRRKGRGIDITLILGGEGEPEMGPEALMGKEKSDEEEELRETGLAPEVEDQMETEPEVETEVEANMEEEGSDPILEKMSEYEKQSLMEQEPKTLAERMKRDLLMKKKG